MTFSFGGSASSGGMRSFSFGASATTTTAGDTTGFSFGTTTTLSACRHGSSPSSYTTAPVSFRFCVPTASTSTTSFGALAATSTVSTRHGGFGVSSVTTSEASPPAFSTAKLTFGDFDAPVASTIASSVPIFVRSGATKAAVLENDINYIVHKTRPVSALNLQEIQAELQGLIDYDSDKVEEELERQNNEVLKETDELEKKIKKIKTDYEKEKARVENEYKEKVFKHKDELRILLAKHQREAEKVKQTFLNRDVRKQELQNELQTRLAPLITSSKLSSVSSVALPECYACLEVMRPPIKLMTCGSGHLICENCYHLMQKKICGKCRTTITGRATDTERLLRSICGED